MKLSKRTKKIMIAAVSVIVLAFLCSLLWRMHWSMGWT